MSVYDDVVTGITQALYAAFSATFPNLRIYAEPVLQGFHGPCFCLQLIESAQDKRIHYQYARTYSFDAMFFPEDGNEPIKQIRGVADALGLALEYIDVGDGIVRGHGMKATTVDTILHFEVIYDLGVLVKPDPDPLIARGTLDGHPIPNKEYENG